MKDRDEILCNIVASLQDLQALNAKDRARIHELATPELLKTCARQSALITEELKEYEGYYQIGTMTPIGMITMVRKNKDGRILKVQIENSKGYRVVTLEELDKLLEKAPMSQVIGIAKRKHR